LGSALTLATGLQPLAATETLAIAVSAALILPALCLTRLLWKSPLTNTITAFLFAVSTPDLYMLCWGGYVNIVTLFMLMIVFFISLSDDLSTPSVMLMGGLLAGSVLLSHHLSAFVFVSLALAVIAVGAVTRQLGKSKTRGWTKPLEKLILITTIGLLVAAPWYASRYELYLGILTPSGVIKEAMTRTNFAYLGLQALASFTGSLTMLSLLWLAPLGFRSLAARRRWYEPLPVTLLVWIALPLALTYSFVFGFIGYTQRFLYFSVHPALVLTAAGLSTLVTLISGFKDRTPRWRALFVIGLLICTYAEGAIVFIAGPNGQYNYFRSIRNEEMSTIEWVETYTPENSLVFANHSLGWWMAGVGRRPTYSATPPQLLAYSYELPLTTAANDTIYAKPNYKDTLAKHGGVYIVVRNLGDPTPNDTPDRTLVREAFRRLASDPDLNLIFASSSIVVFKAPKS